MSIVRDLAELQVGIGRRNVNKLQERMMKNLITSPCRDFKITHESMNKQDSSIFTSMHSGRLFTQENPRPNYEEVISYSAYPTRISQKKKTNPKYEHQKLFSFPCNFECKDYEFWSSPDKNLILHKARQTTSIFYLEDSYFLVRRCCLTGKMEDRIFLSNTLRFDKISSDPQSGLIALRSTKYSVTNVDCVFTIALFSCPPLKFVAMFEVKSSIFGSNIKEAHMTHGMIVISYSDKVALYSLDFILQNAITKRVDNMSEETRLKIGKMPFDLPMNAEIKDRPPALFEVNSCEGGLVIGGNPWHFITKSCYYQSEIKRLDTQQLTAEVVHSQYFAAVQMEKLFFHPDDSKRLVYICNNKLCMYYLKDDHLEPFLVHKEEMPSDNRPLPNPSTARRSGRARRRSLAAREAEESQIWEDDTIHELTMCLDSDSNIFAIFSVVEKDKVTKMLHIVLYDNSTGKLLKKIPLDGKVHKSHIIDVKCHLALEGVNLFAAITGSKHSNLLISLVEKFTGAWNV